MKQYKIAGYCRISVDEELEKENTSIENQKEIIAKYDERGGECVGNIERFKFYDEAQKVYCIISTGEKALYANIMLQKGVVVDK